MPGRRAKRFEIGSLIPVAVESGARRFLGVALDISSNGVLVRCDEVLRAGAIAALAIGSGRDAVRSLAVARRAVEGVGLSFEFRNVSMTDHDLLNRLLLRLSRATITGSTR